MQGRLAKGVYCSRELKDSADFYCWRIVSLYMGDLQDSESPER
jgi:hypothetical protein